MPNDCRNKTKIKFSQVKKGFIRFFSFFSSSRFHGCTLLFLCASLYDISIFHFTCAFDHKFYNTIVYIFFWCLCICSPWNISSIADIYEKISSLHIHIMQSLILAYSIHSFSSFHPFATLRIRSMYVHRTYIYIYHHVKNCLLACLCMAIIDYIPAIRFDFGLIAATITTTLK